MKKIGAYEAKTRLPGLLLEVSRGARISITRRGVPVAMLVPASPGPRPDPDLVIRNLRRLRKGIVFGVTPVGELLEEGRPA